MKDSIMNPGMGLSSTPRIQIMRPSNSRTGHRARLEPVTLRRSKTSLTLRGPEEWRSWTRSPGLQLRKFEVPIAGAFAEESTDCWEPSVSEIRSRRPKAGAEISPGIGTVYSGANPAADVFSEALGRIASRSSLVVRSAWRQWANSSFWPARPLSARSRIASVAE